MGQSAGKPPKGSRNESASGLWEISCGRDLARLGYSSRRQKDCWWVEVAEEGRAAKQPVLFEQADWDTEIPG